jgi:hypothetical protein
MSMPIKILIEGSGFRKLIRGEELVIGQVHMILADIGFEIMRHDIDDAVREQNEARTRIDPDLRGGNTKGRSD